VESFDRLSRDDIWKAQALLADIVSSGVYLVTLSDRRVFSQQSGKDNPFDIILALVVLIRANEESAVKSMRLKAVYDRKRATIRSGEPQTKPFTRRLPAWIRWSDATQSFELINNHTAVIQRIFALADSGQGKKLISTTLNEAGVTPFGVAKFWHSSYIGKILVNPACIGTFVPTARQTVDGKSLRVSQEPVVNYWPAAIDLEVYERVSARFSTVSSRGAHSVREATSVVAGVAQCAVCGSSFVRVSKGEHVYLVCARAHAKAACEYLAVRYRDVEASLVEHIDIIVDDAPSAQGMERLDSAIIGLEVELGDLTDALNDYLDDYRRTKSEFVRQRAADTERRLGEASVKYRHASAEKVRLASPHVTRRLQKLRDCFKATPLDTPAANRALRDCVKTLIIDPRIGRMDIEWHHSSGQQESVPFTSRHAKSIFPDEVEVR
jgi:hypothetical protein